MKIPTVLVVSALASLCLIMNGCGSNSSEGENDENKQSFTNVTVKDEALKEPAAAPGEGRDVSGLAVLGPTYTEGAMSYHGGGGGSYSGHVTPPSVIYAVQVNSGAYVDHIRFAWYQPSRADNLYRTGDAWGSTPVYGGNGGSANNWWYCPSGKGVIGILGNSGAYIDRIGFICGDANQPNPNSPLNSYSPLWGGGGGGWFGENKCTTGRLIDSFNVRSGAYLDGIQAICINAH